MNYILRVLLLLPIIASNTYLIYGQEVPILNYTVDGDGIVQLEVNSTTENYYILKIRHNSTAEFELATSMTLGKSGTTIITESVGSYPLGHYQVLEYSIESPIDTDGDGIDDMTEYQNIPIQNPINAAISISKEDGDGIVALDSFTTYRGLSNTEEFVKWSEFLNGKVYVKYLITDFHTTNPKTYFINSELHQGHAGFANELGVDHLGNQAKKGQVIYHPSTISKNGTLGTFAFNYSNGRGQDFEVVQRTYELLAASMPFLKNDLSYLITMGNEEEYERDFTLFQDSRIPILLEEDVYAEIDYWGLNPAEGYGFFRQMNLNEEPGPKDIVLYDALPNSLPRVGGIMTSVMQTPLSHVNLRAIQDKIPNAFIQDPLLTDSIAELLDHYIYFKVAQDKYTIREATLEEVNDWFEDIRPETEQVPDLNLNYTSILPLDSITFGMADGYGAKCANVAVMRTFGFQEETIPDGFGVPFYFYQEFMKYNSFFEEVESMISDLDFQSDRAVRNDRLKDFRKKIREAALPNWMLQELDNMHQSFPQGTSIRCRSSTNNEDLPGFNGAGLYTSKTQHPEEGSISKSIKQVYASLWNLRAFEEREFYKINHFIASMGVLCHPNYSDEKANGVGVSTDPIYNTSNTFYLNSQIGEDLITNPSNTAIPEEILLDKIQVSENDFIIVQRSSLIVNDSIIMEEHYLDQMRDYLTVIHNEFAKLYNAQTNENFAMDIEYKITKENQLIIKQARPWVSFTPENTDSLEIAQNNFGLTIFPNPAQNYINVQCPDCMLKSLSVTSSIGKSIQEITLNDTDDLNARIDTWDLSPGIYIINGISKNNSTFYSGKFVKK